MARPFPATFRVVTESQTTVDGEVRKLAVAAIGGAVILAAFGYWVFHSGRPPDPRDLAFAEGIELPGNGVTFRLRHEIDPVLHLHTGTIAIVDPASGTFYSVDAEIAPGSYPVRLTVAEEWQPDAATHQDERLAFATVQIGQGIPARWIPAAIPSLGNTTNAPTAIPLSGDSPALADAGCSEAFANKDDESFWNQVITQYGEKLKYQWTSAVASLDDENGCTVLLLYTASAPATPYLGLDSDGNILCLTLDFGILELP